MQTDPPVPGLDGLPCDFCDIIAGRLPRQVRYEDDDLMVFVNRLTWAPLMLLVVPKAHMSQQEFWRSEVFARAATLAVELGDQECPGGYRVVSNIGRDALQTQGHGHLHVVGGTSLGLYVSPRLATWPPAGYAQGPAEQSGG